jgi:hypothetical protein
VSSRCSLVTSCVLPASFGDSCQQNNLSLFDDLTYKEVAVRPKALRNIR